MDETRGEPPSDPALEEEFRLWRTALAEHGHVLPDGQPAAGGTLIPPGETAAPARLPAAARADPSPVDDRGSGRRRLWPATVFVVALVLAVSAVGYRDFSVRRTTVNPPTATPPASAPSLPGPPPDRPAPLDEADRRKAELADNVMHAGEALALSGDAAGALRLYRQGLSLRRELAASVPGNAAIQRALADSWDKVADALAAQADTARALGAYREAEAAWERCAHLLPGDRDVQRSGSLTALSLGNLLLARNDPAGAVEAFQRGVSIQETLCRLEPDNAAWQEDLALGWLRLSDAFDQRADDEAALQACRRALNIDEALVARDATNPAWQADLAAAHGKAADLLLARNEVDLALQEYNAAASCWEKLAAADMTPERRRALAETQDRIGQALEMKKQPAAALPFYRQALGTVANLAAENPTDASLEGLQAAISYHLGRATVSCQPVDRRAARVALSEARDRLTNLKSTDGTFPSKEQAAMLTDVERLFAELDR